MHIEVLSDIVCPWCYVGQARLKQALAERSQCRVSWLPFELNPDMPPDGRNRLDYLRERFGDINFFLDSQKKLVKLGMSLNIKFRFDLIKRSPNTRRAHTLLTLAHQISPAIQNKLANDLFAAYFTYGLDIGDCKVLATLADRNGISAAIAHDALKDKTLSNRVIELEKMGRDWNVHGVPTFILNRKKIFSGAKSLQVFLQAIDA